MEIWKYTWKDITLVIAALLHFIGLNVWCFNYSELSLTINISLILLFTMTMYYQPIIVVHNFVHNPFFISKLLNRIFAVISSASMMMTVAGYKQHHFLHHQYNNDRRKDEGTKHGPTLDPSSTYRFGKDGEHEHFIPYSAFSLFRDATGYAIKRVLKKGEGPQLTIEVIAMVLTLALWAITSWQWLLYMFVPTFFFGWFFAHMEGYFEHQMATDPDSKFANSVSYYGAFYNKYLMFNEGYHQAHHCRPGAHWTTRPEIDKKFKEEMTEAGAYISNYPPLLGFLDKKTNDQ